MHQLLPVPADPVDPAVVYADLPVAPGRPAVRLNMIASLDGAATVGGQVVAGSKRLARNARSGQTFTVAVCDINGPISVSSHNRVRRSTWDFYTPEFGEHH